MELLYSGASDPHAAKIVESEHQLQMIATEANVQLHRVQYFMFHLITSVQIIINQSLVYNVIICMSLLFTFELHKFI